MKIDVESAIGRTTETAITTAQGSMLLPEDFMLTEPIVSALKKQGITHVEVLDNETKAPLSLANRKKVEHIEHLLNQFKGPKMTELKQCLIEQIPS